MTPTYFPLFCPLGKWIFEISYTNDWNEGNEVHPTRFCDPETRLNRIWLYFDKEKGQPNMGQSFALIFVNGNRKRKCEKEMILTLENEFNISVLPLIFSVEQSKWIVDDYIEFEVGCRSIFDFKIDSEEFLKLQVIHLTSILSKGSSTNSTPSMLFRVVIVSSGL